MTTFTQAYSHAHTRSSRCVVTVCYSLAELYSCQTRTHANHVYKIMYKYRLIGSAAFVALKIKSETKFRRCRCLLKMVNQSINQSFNASWQTTTRQSEWVHNCTVWKITIT